MALVNILRDVFTRRTVFSRSIIVEIRSMYAGSILGVVWIFMGPVIFAAIYAAVYGFILKISPSNMSQTQYIFHVLLGILPFFAVSSSLQQSVSIFDSNIKAVLSTVYPGEMYVMKNTLINSIPILVLLLPLVGYRLIFGDNILFDFLYIMFSLFSTLFFIYSMSLILSLIGIVFKDLKYLIGYIMMIMLFLTPIGYTVDMIPEKLRIFATFNPLSWYIINFQKLGSVNYQIFDKYFWLSLVFSCFISYFSANFFHKMRKKFYEYI